MFAKTNIHKPWLAQINDNTLRPRHGWFATIDKARVQYIKWKQLYAEGYNVTSDDIQFLEEFHAYNETESNSESVSDDGNISERPKKQIKL